MEDLARQERAAWASLEGCASEPTNPYSDLFLDNLVRRIPSAARTHSWEEVLRAWQNSTTSQGCANGLILVSVYKNRVAAAVCDHPRLRRLQLGLLGHYRVFKYVLAAALAGLASDGKRPPDALFVLDLTDRADVPFRSDGGDDLVKLASSAGGCRSSLPVPINLKGFGQGYSRFGSKWFMRGWRGWPSASWERKRRTAVWRGALRSYSNCLQPTGSRSGGSACKLGTAAAAPKCACYAKTMRRQQQQQQQQQQRRRAHEEREPILSHAATQIVQMARACGQSCTCAHGVPPHPRTIAVGLSANHGALDAAFVPACSRAHAEGHGRDSFSDCKLETAHARSGYRFASGWPFAQLTNFTALLELDGYGWQAALLAKLTLGSLVVTHRTLYPLWFDELLVSGQHLVRAQEADLSDLPALLDGVLGLGPELEGAASPEEMATNGRRRACELMHLPHLAGYVAALLRRYARRFVGAHSARLHHAVRKLSEAATPTQTVDATRPRIVQPEQLWAALPGTPIRCDDPFWRDPRCSADG